MRRTAYVSDVTPRYMRPATQRVAADGPSARPAGGRANSARCGWEHARPNRAQRDGVLGPDARLEPRRALATEQLVPDHVATSPAPRAQTARSRVAALPTGPRRPVVGDSALLSAAVLQPAVELEQRGTRRACRPSTRRSADRTGNCASGVADAQLDEQSIGQRLCQGLGARVGELDRSCVPVSMPGQHHMHLELGSQLASRSPPSCSTWSQAITPGRRNRAPGPGRRPVRAGRCHRHAVDLAQCRAVRSACRWCFTPRSVRLPPTPSPRDVARARDAAAASGCPMRAPPSHGSSRGRLSIGQVRCQVAQRASLVVPGHGLHSSRSAYTPRRTTTQGPWTAVRVRSSRSRVTDVDGLARGSRDRRWRSDGRSAGRMGPHAAPADRLGAWRTSVRACGQPRPRAALWTIARARCNAVFSVVDASGSTCSAAITPRYMRCRSVSQPTRSCARCCSRFSQASTTRAAMPASAALPQARGS